MMKLDNVKKRIVVAGGAFVVALFAVLWYLHANVEKSADRPATETARAKGKGTVKRGQTAPATSRPPEKKEELAEGQDDSDKQEDEGGSEEESKTDEGQMEEGPTEEELAAEAFWEDLQDGKKWRVPYESGVPREEVEKFRQQFNKIPPGEDKAIYLQHALNLVPDENIMLLAGILLDKSQPEEYLELVYNDILNRDESVKKTLLREIYKDKEHPCWETTAWILDATGESPGK